MTRKQRALLLGTVGILGLGLDQGTKLIAISYQEVIAQPGLSYFFDMFRLVYATNEGAFLSLGSNLDDTQRFLLLTGFNGVILAAVTLFLLGKRRMMGGTAASLSLIVTGGVGNLIDRIFRDGEVIDFMNMGIQIGDFHLRTGIFNIADMAIVGGLVLLVYQEIFGPVETYHDPDEEEEEQA